MVLLGSLEECLTRQSSTSKGAPSVSSNELSQRIKLEFRSKDVPLRLRQLLGCDSEAYITNMEEDNAIINHLLSDIVTVHSILSYHNKKLRPLDLQALMLVNVGAICPFPHSLFIFMAIPLEITNEQQLISAILMAILTPPITLRQQCRTQVVNEDSTVHFPTAQFDIMVNKVNDDGQDAHDPQVAISFNGTCSATSTGSQIWNAGLQ